MSGEAYFLVPGMPPPGRFVLDGDEGRHAAAVRRIRPGERIVLADGAGARAVADVVATARNSVTVDVGEARVEPSPELRVTVVQALPKGERSDLAVELATEAGVDRIVPWQSARCVARWAGPNGKADRGRERWQRTAREAAKQSRRSRVPVICPLATTDDVVRIVTESTAALMLHESAAQSLKAAELPSAGELVVIVGPEGGLAPDEITRLEGAGADAVRLGPQVLRTSTAAAVALGAVGALTGRWA